MRALISGWLVLSLLTACQRQELPPLAEGEHVFTLKDAEFPDIDLGTVTLRVRAERITVINHTGGLIPAGTLEEGVLMWHARSKQWIIGASPADASAADVGGCSTGPSVVDLVRKIYWTC